MVIVTSDRLYFGAPPRQRSSPPTASQTETGPRQPEPASASWLSSCRTQASDASYPYRERRSGALQRRPTTPGSTPAAVQQRPADVNRLADGDLVAEPNRRRQPNSARESPAVRTGPKSWPGHALDPERQQSLAEPSRWIRAPPARRAGFGPPLFRPRRSRQAYGRACHSASDEAGSSEARGTGTRRASIGCA